MNPSALRDGFFIVVVFLIVHHCEITVRIKINIQRY